MTCKQYLKLRRLIRAAGYGQDIDWAQNLEPCPDADVFCREYIFVVCNSGMKWQIARRIYDRIIRALARGIDVSNAFGHKQKVAAIKYVYARRAEVFKGYSMRTTDEDKLAFLCGLPWIGDITKWHLAKNLGMDVAKPDRHLTRIAKRYETDPQRLCRGLSYGSGDRVATVDTVIWRAANLGMI